MLLDLIVIPGLSSDTKKVEPLLPYFVQTRDWRKLIFGFDL